MHSGLRVATSWSSLGPRYICARTLVLAHVHATSYLDASIRTCVDNIYCALVRVHIRVYAHECDACHVHVSLRECTNSSFINDSLVTAR